MNTDLIYPKTMIDDACDWTPVIVWRMNASARARSRSVFVPCPQPQSILGITPKFKAPKKVKSRAKKNREKKTSEISAQQLVAIMKGKTLSHQGILKAIEKHYPDIKITAHHLRKRIDRMLSSNHVGITKHDDTPITYFTLQSVDPKFYVLSEKAMRA